MAQRWPPKPPKMASKTPNLGLQTSQLRYELHLPMAPKLSSKIAPYPDLQNGLKMTPNEPQDGLRELESTSVSVAISSLQVWADMNP